MIAFANIAEKGSPKDTLTEQVATKMYFEKMEHYYPERYQNQITLYQNHYNLSNKSELCRQTVESLIKQTEFERQMDYETIKNDLVQPVVATFSDEQVLQLNLELKNYTNGKGSALLDEFGKKIFQHANELMHLDTQNNITFGDLYKNCPIANQ